MCGIAAYIGDNAVQHVVAALRLLEIRGYDSAGIAFWDGCIRIVKGVGYVERVFEESLPYATIALGHVRWATHGSVSQINAHPHTDCIGRIAVCHNGVIENIDELKTSLSSGHVFRSETDTEIIAHCLEDLDIESGLIEISDALRGHNSFAVLSEGRILASCGGPPLLVANGQIASDAVALTTTEFQALRPGDVVEISSEDIRFIRGTPHVLYSNRWAKRPMGYQKKGAATRFATEIAEQPEAMKAALNNEHDNLVRACRQMQNSVVLTGAGSSKVACMWAKDKFVEAGLFVDVIPIGEWFSRPIPKTKTVIAVSQSGETGTLVPLIDSLKCSNHDLIAVVNTPWSFLARHANIVLQLFCGEERSVIASKSFMTQCIVLGHLASQLRNLEKQYKEAVVRASCALADWLPGLQTEISKLEIWFERCFVLGEGEFYPIAHEGAMKLKEGAYIFAEPMIASEFKHEALPLITKDELVLWVGETNSGGIAQVAEIRARGATVIGISVEDLGFDAQIQLPREAIEFPPLAVVPLQLLTQHIATHKKINVDRPRNLAKAITVK